MLCQSLTRVGRRIQFEGFQLMSAEWRQKTTETNNRREELTKKEKNILTSTKASPIDDASTTIDGRTTKTGTTTDESVRSSIRWFVPCVVDLLWFAVVWFRSVQRLERISLRFDDDLKRSLQLNSHWFDGNGSSWRRRLKSSIFSRISSAMFGRPLQRPLTCPYGFWHAKILNGWRWSLSWTKNRQSNSGRSIFDLQWPSEGPTQTARRCPSVETDWFEWKDGRITEPKPWRDSFCPRQG